MSLVQDHQNPSDDLHLSPSIPESESEKIKSFPLTKKQTLVPGRHNIHHPSAGLNPLVDAAARLFSLLGQLKLAENLNFRDELIQELTSFHDAILSQGYSNEYAALAHYVVCATFDDILHHNHWSDQKTWRAHSLLNIFHFTEQNQEDKFFSIMERVVKEPNLYIDLMELLYLCLSMGYQGFFRTIENSNTNLQLLKSNLYKHIRAYRGNFNKAISPAPLKISKIIITKPQKSTFSPFFIFLITACVIMGFFISLCYLMDVISNEAYSSHQAIYKAPKNARVE